MFCSGPPTWVRLGELDISSTEEDADPQDYRVTRTINHPAYRLPSVYHDIALVKLEKVVTISSFIKPVCLYPKEDVDADIAIATGWGATTFGGNKNVLSTVNV